MKKSLLFLALISLLSLSLNAQPGRKTVLFSGFTGAVFAQNAQSVDDVFQTGFEGNYFIKSGISISAGLDYRTIGNGVTMMAFGTRIYPKNGSFFFRHRSMIGVKSRFSNDYIIGVGNNFMIDENWTIEAKVDYHFVSRGIGLRAGIGFYL